MAAKGTEQALRMLRNLPRVSMANLRDNPGATRPKKQNRGSRALKSYGYMKIDKHGHGHGKMKQHGCLPPLGFEGGKSPWYLHVPQEFYYQGFHLRRQYPPMSMLQLQRLIDQGMLDPDQPIDLTQLCKAGVKINPTFNHYGVNLTDDGVDLFQSCINLEVQWCNEVVIAAVERAGGVITTAFYDMTSVYCAAAPQHWFKQGNPVPRRLLPPQDTVAYYSDAKNRGYLASPRDIERAREETAQKFGYELPNLAASPKRELLALRKHHRQVFHGLEPGWVVDLSERVILKPRDERVRAYYENT